MKLNEDGSLTISLEHEHTENIMKYGNKQYYKDGENHVYNISPEDVKQLTTLLVRNIVDHPEFISEVTKRVRTEIK